MTELSIDNSLGNSTFTIATLPKETIMDNHRSVLMKMKYDELYVSSLSTGIIIYTRILTNSIELLGLPKCSTKPLNKLLTPILSAVKGGRQNYCDTSYSTGGMNQMWNSKDM